MEEWLRMTEKRFTVKSQDNYFGVTDNLTDDKVNVVNGIHTEIEAKWLCDLLNALHEENEQLKEDNLLLIEDSEKYRKLSIQFDNRNKELISENEQLKQQLVDVTKSIDSLCNRVDKVNRSNEFKWGAIMGLRTLQRELKGDFE